MGRCVIVAYKPKPGCGQLLEGVVAKHLEVLAREGLIADRGSCTMRAADGTIVEVFAWRSAEAIAQAHDNAAVGALWAEFAQVCDYVPLASLPETSRMFAEFAALA